MMFLTCILIKTVEALLVQFHKLSLTCCSKYCFQKPLVISYVCILLERSKRSERGSLTKELVCKVCCHIVLERIKKTFFGKFVSNVKKIVYIILRVVVGGATMPELI